MNLRSLALGMLIAAVFSGGAAAQALNVSFQFSGAVDCDQPRKVSNVPVSGRGTGVIHPDRRATLELITPNASRIRLEATLGGRPVTAPGGTAELRVATSNRLRMTWSLPNNDFIIDIAAAKNACTLRIETRLKPGSRQYSLLSNGQFHFCGKPRITQTTCTLR